MEHFLGLPEQASAHAAEVDFVMGLVHWLVFALFFGWICYFIYALYKFRASKQPKADYIGVRSKTSSYIEGAVALFEAVLLIGFSIPLWAERVNEFPSGPAIVARVVGEQFAWNVHYPGPDGRFGRTDLKLIDTTSNPLGLDRNDADAKDDVVTLNQLHLPVNKPAIIHLTSKDVIHSFNLTEMRVKQDAIPGLSIPVWFTPTMTTEQLREVRGDPKTGYEIACAQLCGLGHFRMRGFMTIHTQEGFDQWMTQQVEAARQLEADPFAQQGGD